jgi:hypothetical protein
VVLGATALVFSFHSLLIPMLTKSQRTFISTTFAAVSAALVAIPYQQNLPARLLAKCTGTNPEARALWWLAMYLGKPSRIPSHFGTLLRLGEDSAIAAAIVSEYGELLHTVLSQKAIHRMNCIELAHTA